MIEWTVQTRFAKGLDWWLEIGVLDEESGNVGIKMDNLSYTSMIDFVWASLIDVTSTNLPDRRWSPQRSCL
jgi:hypothetical protein